MRHIWLILVAGLVAGCGGAGGGSPAAGSAQPAQLSVEIRTQGESAATVIYAVDFVLHLPAGVTLAADPTSGKLSEGVLHAADPAALVGTRYQPATGATPAEVTVFIGDPVGYAVGTLAAINCIVSPGTPFDTSGFTLSGFSARDANGIVLSGIAPKFTVRTQ
jgi:hypothetical protein